MRKHTTLIGVPSIGLAIIAAIGLFAYGETGPPLLSGNDLVVNTSAVNDDLMLTEPAGEDMFLAISAPEQWLQGLGDNASWIETGDGSRYLVTQTDDGLELIDDAGGRFAFTGATPIGGTNNGRSAPADNAGI